MKKETKKLPRFTEKHGAYYWTPTIDGQTKWFKLSRDRDEALMLYEEREHGPTDYTVNQMLDLFMAGDRWQGVKKTGGHEPYSARTKETYSGHIVVLREELGSKPIEAVDPIVLTRFIAKIGYKGNYCVSLLSSAYKLAVAEGWTARNPANKGDITHAKRPRRNKHVKLEEIMYLRERAHDDRLKRAIDLSLLTALRKTDLLGLTRESITDRGLVVEIHKTKAEGRVLEFGWTPELREACKYIPIGYTVAAIDAAWSRLKKECGIQDLRWHDLRRYALQEARRQGGLKEAQELADHRDASMTENYMRGAPRSVTPLSMPDLEPYIPTPRVVNLSDYR